jgi:DNA-binding NtrC family response regulator
MMTREDLHANPPVFSLSRGRALVVDQDRKDLQTYGAILREMGFEVRCSSYCREALRWLQEVPVEFVFVNQGNGEFEWQAIVQCALARDRHIPVIVMTRKLDVGCYLEAIHLGATDYVEKPLSTAQMERLVTTYSPSQLMNPQRQD